MEYTRLGIAVTLIALLLAMPVAAQRVIDGDTMLSLRTAVRQPPSTLRASSFALPRPP